MTIIKRIRRWFIDKYLPAYIREAEREDRENLLRKIAGLERAAAERESYIQGLEYGYRAMRNIRIQIGKGGRACGVIERAEEHKRCEEL